MTICQMCQSLLDRLLMHRGPIKVPSYVDHYTTIQALELSTKSGCKACSVLWSQISKRSLPWDPKSTLTFLLGPRMRYAYEGKQVELTKRSMNPTKHTFFQMKLCRDIEFDIEISEESHFLGLAPMSDLKIAQGLSWIEKSEGMHPSCNARYDTEFVPTRLIDVGKKGKAPRLIETKNTVMDNNRYLTLSHCWGLWMPKHFTTRSDTLQDRLAKIPLKRLPKTFNEAIKITRKLGLRYIWIDSLCIIQDSLDDWRQESALMGKVYSHCFCMLAAVSSSNCHGGLFQTPTLYSVLRERDENDGKIVLLKPTARSWRDSLLESPLSRRGWTLQERELSPRILHFVDGVMHFECRQGFGEGKRSFDGYYSDEARAKTARTIRCMDPILARGGKVQWLESTAAIPEERYNRWLRMVEGYSQRKLSVLSDKFPAVSGLAAEYSYLLKDDYIAGLWRKDLIRGLCWRKGTKTPRSLVIDYGPSWSWAKIVGPVDYGLLQVIDNDGKEVNVAPIDCSSGNQNHQILPFIYDACTEPEGTDPNGTLTFALIRMRVKMIKLVFQQRTTWRVGNEIVEVVWDDKPNEFRSYYLLSLGKVNLGLVVTQTESQKDTYERVGIARITEKDPGTWFSNSVTQDISLI